MLRFGQVDFWPPDASSESCEEREGELRKKLAEEQVRIQDDPRSSKLSKVECELRLH